MGDIERNMLLIETEMHSDHEHISELRALCQILEALLLAEEVPCSGVTCFGIAVEVPFPIFTAR